MKCMIYLAKKKCMIYQNSDDMYIEIFISIFFFVGVGHVYRNRFKHFYYIF